MTSDPGNMDRHYPSRPWVGIGVVLLRGDEVLLIRRNRPPSQGEWSLPGGAQHVGETAEAAARRELREETGLTVGDLRLLGHADLIHRDEAGGVQYHYTVLDFVGAWHSGVPDPQDDADAARFVRHADLPAYHLPASMMEMITRAFSQAR